MNILSISGIMPEVNDFVFEFYSHYLKEFSNDRITFILPVKYTNRLTKLFFPPDPVELKAGEQKTYHYRDFEVQIPKFLSAWRSCNLHAFLSAAFFRMNKKMIDHIIRHDKIEVVHAQFIFPDGMLAYHIWKKYKIPYIVTSHNELRYFDHAISKRLALKIFRNAFRVIPLNYLNYQTFLQNNLNNVLHIPLGFDEKLLKVKKNPRHEEVRILTAARLIKLKNIDKVILALARLDQKYNFTYTIVGEGPEKENLASLINKHHLQDRIQLKGKVPHHQMADVLSEHDIFIMPSYFETFGRAYFEAMAIKLPVICAKNSGIYGFFEEMKEGISVDHTSIDDIAEKLELLISDKALREKMGHNGHELVKNFTWKNLSIRYRDIYKDALDKGE
jgi:glycosyltransferase involved in cell wall biosynthesis